MGIFNSVDNFVNRLNKHVDTFLDGQAVEVTKAEKERALLRPILNQENFDTKRREALGILRSKMSNSTDKHSREYTDMKNLESWVSDTDFSFNNEWNGSKSKLTSMRYGFLAGAGVPLSAQAYELGRYYNQDGSDSTLEKVSNTMSTLDADYIKSAAAAGAIASGLAGVNKHTSYLSLRRMAEIAKLVK